MCRRTPVHVKLSDLRSMFEKTREKRHELVRQNNISSLWMMIVPQENVSFAEDGLCLYDGLHMVQYVEKFLQVRLPPVIIFSE